jgi:hypothetical protein
MFTSDSQPIIADSEYEVTKVLVKKGYARKKGYSITAITTVNDIQ